MNTEKTVKASISFVNLFLFSSPKKYPKSNPGTTNKPSKRPTSKAPTTGSSNQATPTSGGSGRTSS